MKRLPVLAAVAGTAVVVGSLVPAVAALPLPPLAPSVAGQWIYVGWSSTTHRIVDVVRLDLINYPLGTLSGSWTEGTAPHYESLGLNGTECIGCNGPPGIYWDSFGVSGRGDTYTDAFSIDIGNDSNEQLLGGLGGLPPGTAKWYGCTPFDGSFIPPGYAKGAAADLFVLAGASAYVFYRRVAYNGETIGVGAKVRCY